MLTKDILIIFATLESGNKVLDLGVWFDEKLSFSEHIQTNINKAYMMLGIIKRNFKHCILVWLDHISTIALLCGHHIKKEI